MPNVSDTYDDVLVHIFMNVCTYLSTYYVCFTLIFLNDINE